MPSDTRTVDVGALRLDVAAEHGVDPEAVQIEDAAFTLDGVLVLDLVVAL